MRLEEQNEKAESCRENLWNKMQLKGPKRQKQTQEQKKKEWASPVSLCQSHKPQYPRHVKVSPWDEWRVSMHSYVWQYVQV